LQSFLREAGARPRRASVDRARGDRGAAYDRSTAYDRGAGNGIRNAHAAAAVEVGIDVGVRVGIGVVVSVVVVVVIIVVVVVVAWGLRTERPWAFDADQTTRLEPRIIRHILHNRLFQHIRISKRKLRLNDRLHADHSLRGALNLLNWPRGCVGGEAR